MQEVKVSVIAVRICRSVEHKPRGKGGCETRRGRAAYPAAWEPRGLRSVETPSQMAFQQMVVVFSIT